MRVTLDTNVLVSGTFWNGNSFRILDGIDKKRFENVISKDIIVEYNEAVNSDEITDKVKNKGLVVNKVVHKVIQNSNVVVPTKKVDVIKDDPDDNRILECAKEGKIDYIVTQDKHLLRLREFEEIPIITPEEFLKLIEK
jgi:putative PIN family toxin of toxin-antitoxin system